MPTTFTSNSRSASDGAQRGHPGAVEDAVDVAQRAPHLAAVEEVALDGLVLEAGEVLVLRRVLAIVSRRSSPRSASARATCEPMNPAPPVTSVFGMSGV